MLQFTIFTSTLSWRRSIRCGNSAWATCFRKLVIVCCISETKSWKSLTEGWVLGPELSERFPRRPPPPSLTLPKTCRQLILTGPCRDSKVTEFVPWRKSEPTSQSPGQEAERRTSTPLCPLQSDRAVNRNNLHLQCKSTWGLDTCCAGCLVQICPHCGCDQLTCVLENGRTAR